MKKWLLLAIILEILILITVFTFMLMPPQDPDLGWHLRYGQYFWQTGKILTRDIFSSTMPNYYWANVSWGYDVIIYPFFKTFGFMGLSIWGAVTVTLAFIFITLAYKVKPWLKMLLLPPYLMLGYGVAWVGMRAQLDTVLGIAIVYFLVSRKKFFYLPFVFLIWANLHGGVILGLFIWSILLAWRGVLEFRDVKKRKELITEFGFFIISFLACLINPFTYQIFTEDFKVAISRETKSFIVEWMPIDYGSSDLRNFYIYSAIIMVMSAFALIKDWKKFSPNVLIATVFFYLTLDSRRYLIIYTLLSFPVALIIFKQIQDMLAPKLHKLLDLLALVIIIPFLCYALFIRLPTLNLTTFDWNTYCLKFGCSEKLTSYLDKYPPLGYGFNTYDWGGYLLWRVPQIKTFVDSRMNDWKENGVYPFRDFINIYSGVDWVKAFEKENFSWAIVVSGTNLDKYLSSLTTVGKWKEYYRDDRAAYYIRLK